ncbi:antitoxin [Bailinhaonella thermotolerans]|nr:antitoxin [Bailinhaonella thermotolerans]
MGFGDRLKDMMGQNRDRMRQGLDRAGDEVNKRTDGKWAKQTEQAKRKAGEQIDQWRKKRR